MKPITTIDCGLCGHNDIPIYELFEHIKCPKCGGAAFVALDVEWQEHE
jgi:ribosomal protein S27AE